MDYSNLGKRAKTAKENIDKPREPMENGEYKCVFRGLEYTTSRKGNPMFVVKMKVTDKSASERMSGETLIIRFVVTPNTEHQLDRFLAIINDWGYDLSQVKCDDDWEEVSIDLMAARAKAVIEVEQSPSKDGEKMYYEFYWKEVIRALNLDELEGLDASDGNEDEDEKEEKPKSKSKTKTKKAKKEEPKPETEESDSSEDDGW